MTKPGYKPWATNVLWAGGADAGLPSKVPPAAGQQAEGYYPGLKVAASIWNYERWVHAERLNNVAASRPFNWAETRTVLGAGGYPQANTDLVEMAWDAAADTVLLMDGDQAGGAIAARVTPSYPGGLELGGGAAPGGADSAMAGARIACDLAGNRGCCLADVAPADTRCKYYPAGGPWANWGGVAPGAGTVFALLHWGDGVWVCTESGLAPGSIYRTLNGAAAFAAAATPPGFAGGVAALHHSGHAAGDVWPADPGNLAFLALTTTQSSVSVDAGVYTTWSAAAAHGMATVIPYDIGYSKIATTWRTIMIDTGTGFPHIGTSTDNGATWAKGAALNSTVYAGATVPIMKLATDGYGQWVLAMVDPPAGTGLLELYASIDDAASWERVYLPFTPSAIDYVDVLYGGGRFFIATNGLVGVGGDSYHFSLRLGD